MPDNYPPILEIGSKVTFIDTDGDEHRALVVSSVPDDDYITLVVGDNGELGNDYISNVTTRTSIFPHPDEWDGPTASETNAYKSGWD